MRCGTRRPSCWPKPSTCSRKNSATKTSSTACTPPEAECIAKGKTRQPYEFGVKVSIATTHKEGLVVGIRSMPGSPYDGHTLYETLEQVAILTDHQPKEVFVDFGYRGADVQAGTKVYHHKLKRDITGRLARHPAPQRHRAGDRAHEQRRQATTQLAQRHGWRCVQRAAMRLRSQPSHDLAKAAAFLRLYRSVSGIAALYTGTGGSSGTLS